MHLSEMQTFKCQRCGREISVGQALVGATVVGDAPSDLIALDKC
jgi:hypothetical protein